jgi:YegS/Rv2252/BmrU family lipid kinase
MSSRIKILFIVNPISGIGKQKRFEKVVNRNLNKEKFDYTIEYTQYAGHATELAAAAVGKYDVVTAVGGDGSINEIAKALVKTETALAIIPCGSGNGLARALRIPVQPWRAVKFLNTAEFKTIDTCQVNDKFFLSIAGAGYDSQVARRYEFFPGRGFKTYFLAIISSFHKYKPLEYEINIDGVSIKRTALLVTVCNSSQYGYGFRISPKASLTDGLLDVVIVKKPEPWRVPFVLLNILLGRAHKSKCFEILQGKHVELFGNKKRWVNLDGETVRLDQTLNFEVERHNIVIFS